MINALNPRIPVYDPNGSIKDKFANYCDSYLTLSPVYAEVKGYDFHNHEVVEIKTGEWSLPHIAKATLKAVSYTTIILPIIAYLASSYFRATHQYHIEAPAANIPPVINLREEDDEIAQPQAHIITPEDSRDEKFRKVDAAIAEHERNHDNLPTEIDLVRNQFLEHCSIGHIITRYFKETLSSTDQKKFVHVRIDASTYRNARYQLTNKKNILDDFKKETLDGHPSSGAMAISIHRGNHYNGIYVDFDQKLIVCYEPFGNANENSGYFRTVVSNLKANYFDNPEQVNVRYIKKVHQQDGVNCGRYVINFLHKLLSSEDKIAAIATLESESISADEIRDRMITLGKTYLNHNKY